MQTHHGIVNRENRSGTPKRARIVSNSPRNGPELAKIVSVDDRHISTPWGSTTMEIALGPKMVSNSPRNGLGFAGTMSVDDGHANAPWDRQL